MDNRAYCVTAHKPTCKFSNTFGNLLTKLIALQLYMAESGTTITRTYEATAHAVVCLLSGVVKRPSNVPPMMMSSRYHPERSCPATVPKKVCVLNSALLIPSMADVCSQIRSIVPARSTRSMSH